jgi:hypothetical protein
MRWKIAGEYFLAAKARKRKASHCVPDPKAQIGRRVLLPWGEVEALMRTFRPDEGLRHPEPGA